MITLIPSSLRPFNVPALAKASDLHAPVHQIGSLPTNAHVYFCVEPTKLTNPTCLRTFEAAAEEGYVVAYVAGGGRTIEERVAASVWAFLPTTILKKISLDDVLGESKLEQSLTTSHTAPVVPTKEGFDRFKGRPGAEPKIMTLAPDVNSEQTKGAGHDAAPTAN